jgi:fructokinase
MDDVWVVGESLIDILPSSKGVQNFVGGGPANTAKALANLGIKTYFLGGISDDENGLLISNELLQYGLNLDLSFKSKLPTATARVFLDSKGSAKYEFKWQSTASFDFGNWLPSFQPSAIYLGSLATFLQPGANKIYEWARKKIAPIIYDPNIRPQISNNLTEYRNSFLRWAKIASVIKMSTEEIDWLGVSNDEIIGLGVKLLVVTKGEFGLQAITTDDDISVPAQPTKVIDTIGAGDIVGAVILEGILNHGWMNGQELKSVLNRAAKAAAITCRKSGAVPPTLEELNA